MSIDVPNATSGSKDFIGWVAFTRMVEIGSASDVPRVSCATAAEISNEIMKTTNKVFGMVTINGRGRGRSRALLFEVGIRKCLP